MDGESDELRENAGGFEFDFERLIAWRKAVDLANLLYEVTRSFPDHERFGLTAQMRRAGVSVPSNLAEGASRSSRTDFARFIELATGSLFELVTQAQIASGQGFLPAGAVADIRHRAAELTRILSGLRRSVLAEPSAPSNC